MEKTTTIALTGPESSGKSVLTKQLAHHYSAPYIEEYARTYLKNIGSDYTEQDVITMAKKQFEWEDAAIEQKERLVFFDTDAINFKIWFEFYGNKTPDFIEERIQAKPYKHLLLLYPNTPWIADGLRKNKADRLHLFKLFEKHIKHYNYSYTIIDKLENQRLTQAIKVVDKLLI